MVSRKQRSATAPTSYRSRTHTFALLSLLAIAALLLGCGGPAGAPAPETPTPAPPTETPVATSTPETPAAAATPTISPQITASQLRVFTELWETVRDNYLHEDFNGVDWDDAGQRYQARVEAGLDRDAFFQAMGEMVEELGDDHTYYVSAPEAAEQSAEVRGELAFVGIGVRLRLTPDGDKVVILEVVPGGPAEVAGVRSHDTMLAVNDEPVVDLGEGLPDALRGMEGSELRLEIQTPGQEPREVVVTRAMVEFHVVVDAHRLPETGIGYLLIPSFWEEGVGRQFVEAVDALMAEGDLAGLIVDLRINDGGFEEEMQTALSPFIGGELGAFVSREGQRLLVVTPLPTGNSLDVPMVVLVGRQTQSAGEIFAGVLQEQGRARVVGRTTPGNVEATWQWILADGSQVWIAQETFRPPSGVDWEETGIVPDLEIPLDWQDFTTENDEQLQAAVDWLQWGLE
jgi:C-terminal peptidase prc